MKSIDTLIFDLDGTILDTLGDLADSVNYALGKQGLSERSYEEIRGFVGNGIRNLIERSVPDNTSAKVVDEVFQMFKEHYKIHCKDKTKPYKGVDKLLNKLSNAGYNMTIISNKAHNAVVELHKEFFYPAIKTAFGERTGVPRKPDSEAIDSVLYEIKAQKENCIYIGDSEVDYYTAKNANMKLVMVSWGFRDREVLEKLGVDLIADSPDELFEIINNLA